MPDKQHSITRPTRVAPTGSLGESATSWVPTSVQQRPVVLLRRPQVLVKLGICRSALHQWLDPESPYYLPDMPRPIKLSERSRNSYWIEEEIDLFIQQRVAQARQPAAQGAY